MNEKRNFDYKRLHPFKWYILENFPFLEDSIDVLTNYQLFCKLGEMYNKQVDSINTLGVQVEGITDWFDNLDVQDEINNKLDEMAEDGTLQEIITSYLDTKAIFCFDTVSDMKSSTTLINGSYAKTLGYYTKNDDGGALYEITDTQTITGHQEELDSGLYATLIIEDSINVKQLGAYGDGEHDDNDAIEKAFDLAFESKKEITGSYSNNKTIVFPNGIYLNSAVAYYEDDYLDRIIINGNNSIITGYGLRFGAKPAQNIIINNLCFRNINECIRFDEQNREYQSITLNNCTFINCDNTLYIDRQSCMVELNNCQFRGCGKSMYLKNCDQVAINNCWFETRTETVADKSCFIEQDGNSEGCIIVKDSFFIPLWSGTEISWFRVSHMFQAENCRFSGENPNQMAIVYTSSQIESVSSSSHRSIIDIRNCPLIATPVSIIVEGVPNSIKYQNNSGNSLGTPIIKWSSAVTEEQQLTKLVNKISTFKIFLSGNDMRTFDKMFGYINLPSNLKPTIPINMYPFIRRGFLNQDGNIQYTIDNYSGTFPSFTSVSIHIRNMNSNYRSLIGNGFLVAYRVNDSGVLNMKTVVNLISLNRDTSDNHWKYVESNIVGGRTGDLTYKINGTEDYLDFTTIGNNYTIDISKSSGKSVEDVQITPFVLPNILDCGQES